MSVSSAAQYPRRARWSPKQERPAHGLPPHYRLLGEIGRGGSSVVHLASDERYGRYVAIKMLRNDRASTAARARFECETKTMASLRHPNILPIFDSGELHGLPFYVTPFIADGTLAERITEMGRLPWPEALRIAVQVGDALSAVHADRVVHLDVKPANVLLEHGRAVLADFGIARHFAPHPHGELPKKPAFSGTPCYMSPEQAVAADVDERADVYSLACLLYEMLVGDPPFNGPSPRAICARQLTEAVPSLRRAGVLAPECAEEALKRALASNPSDRFPSITAFIRECQKGAEGRRTARHRLHPGFPRSPGRRTTEHPRRPGQRTSAPSS
jgi:serine/threonine-protein kinase